MDKAPTCCDGCSYWRSISNSGRECCCHYLLDTDKRCGRKGNKCPGRTTDALSKRRNALQLRRAEADWYGGDYGH